MDEFTLVTTAEPIRYSNYQTIMLFLEQVAKSIENSAKVSILHLEAKQVSSLEGPIGESAQIEFVIRAKEESNDDEENERYEDIQQLERSFEIQPQASNDSG
jgi:hypothetical protein